MWHWLQWLTYSPIESFFLLFPQPSNPTIHGRAVNTVRNLLTSHDTDERYAEPEVKARVAALFLPLISVVIDALPQLHSFTSHKCQ